MGHGSSKELPETTNTEGASTPSSRIKRPHIRRIFRRLTVSRGNGSSSSSSTLKLVSAEDFAGIALLTLISADMQQFKDKWLACVSFGEQTFRTHISDQTEKPVWNSEKKLLLEKNGPRLARISVFETNRISKNNLVGYCEIDLLELLTQDSDSGFEVFELFDPAATGKVVGRISLSCSVKDPIETEKNFARRILAIVDYNDDGKLSFSEFSDLIKAFGNQVADNKKEELFKAADKNGDDAVSMDELAELLAFQQENEPLINCCPVCGEILEVSDKLNTLVHLSLCFDEGTGNQVMTGGFLTDKQASYGWMFKLSEWAHFSSYDVGLNSGSSASHILVKETLLVAREGRVWCLEDRLVLGGFDWDPTLQEKACWSRRPFDRVCMPLDKWRGVRVLLEGDTLPLCISAHCIIFLPLQFSVFKILVVVENERYCDEDFSGQGREESRSFLYSCAQACNYKKATSKKSFLFVGSSVDLNYKGS